MRPIECPHEHDLVDAIAAGRWPDRCDAVLRAHVESCDVCSDVAEVVVPLRDDYVQAIAAARVPTAGAVWWRAQVRARIEAQAAAARPLRAFTAVALASVAGLIAAVLTLSWPWIRTWLWALGIDAPALPDPGGLVSAVFASGSGLRAAVAVLCVAVPLALVFAVAERRSSTR